MPGLLVQIALIVILGHAFFQAIRSLRVAKPDWLGVAFQLSVAIVVLWWLVDFF